ncbi:helix-turn-helix domain-containing protein [Synechococcales cyanobacterium C]|uniref:Helix-turn-helix domain-containing protein n=1 Tax=Petrachloros mirabilis ULC683 TaxID=2781853 RepID=A0A8K2A906_9CYAN|nr:AraC family transcriptional regulator [Petrachloros mirabilis]NCJ08616.1 helix-turn-helix domain-containing protein [Petrachloros mirabilis ULC683]
MTIALSGEAWEQLGKELNDNAQPLSPFEWKSSYPRSLGYGYRQDIDLRSGIWLALHDYTLRDDLRVENFACFEAGDFELVFQLSSGFSHHNGYGVSAGQNYLIRRFTNQKLEWVSMAKERTQAVDIHVEPSVFRSFVADRMDLLEPELSSIFEEKHGRFFQPHTTTPAMQRALIQMLNCPYQGLTRRIYLEGKALELIALQLEQTIHSSNARIVNQLCRDDVDRIHYAREILAQNLSQPPSILELARRVGMSESKLHRGFRQVLGTTPFSYLRDYRLDQGRFLLEIGAMTVTEVARAVGYTSQSRFCDAFKQKFGITPKSCRQGQQSIGGS